MRAAASGIADDLGYCADPAFVAVEPAADAFQNSVSLPGGPRSHALEQSRPDSWGHLRRRFRLWWDRSNPSSSSFATHRVSPPQQSSSPSGSPPARSSSASMSSVPSRPSSSPLLAPRWERSLAAVVASSRAMAGVPPRSAPGGGWRGGPVRPNPQGLLQPSPAGRAPGAGSGTAPGFVAPFFGGSAALSGVTPPAPGLAPVRPLQQPSQQYGPPAYMPQVQQQSPFQSHPFAPMMFPGYPPFNLQQPQQPVQQSVPTVGQVATRTKRRKKKSSQPGPLPQQLNMQPFAQPLMQQPLLSQGQPRMPPLMPQQFYPAAPALQPCQPLPAASSGIMASDILAPAATANPGAGEVLPVPAGPIDSVAANTVGKAKGKNGAGCWKCFVDTHSSKECTVLHYCLLCDNSAHPTMRCPTLRLPKPAAFTAGFGTDDTLFLQLPDSVYKAHLVPTSVPTALVTIVGEPVNAVAIQILMSRMCPFSSQWTWEALPHGSDAFLISFPSLADL